MPELPEVETIKRDINAVIAGDKIHGVDIIDKVNLRDITPTKFIETIKNKDILRVNRIGKMIAFELSENWKLLFHLKMTGNFLFSSTIPKYAKIVFKFQNNGNLIFSDIRKFGVIYLKQNIQTIPYIRYLGIDPTSTDFTIEAFYELIHKFQRRNIKSFLMDQHIMAGIGNIYASEIMFLCHMHPQRVIASLSVKESENLFLTIMTVLLKAIKNRGTTFSNYVDTKGQKGH